MRMPIRIWFEYESELERIKAEVLANSLTASAFPWLRETERRALNRHIQSSVNARITPEMPKTVESYKRKLGTSGIGVEIKKKE